MSILPVLDLMNGQIVRGVAGRREEYRPIVSKLIDSAEPLAVARAFRDQFGFTEFYLADLDAIQHGRVSVGVYEQLRQDGFRLWIDAGLHGPTDAAIDLMLEAKAAAVIVGLETLGCPMDLREIVERVGPERSVFSLDLKAGQPLGNVLAWVQGGAWKTADSWRIAEHAIAYPGVRRLIVLDLAHVGVGAGVPTEDLCARLKQTYPDVQISTGGGVRMIDDVKRLTSIGVDRVLVASALHDGRITPDDVKRL